MKQSKIHDNFEAESYLSARKANHKFIETGHVRRAKLHAARLIDVIDSKKVISRSSTLHQLLEASLFLGTTDSKILAAHLKRSPAIVRAEFQRVRTILGEYQTNSKASIDLGK